MNLLPIHHHSKDYPHLLLDTLLERLQLKNDAALSRELGLAPPRISKVRRRHIAANAELVLRIHETFDIPIAELRALVQADRALHAAHAGVTIGDL